MVLTDLMMTHGRKNITKALAFLYINIDQSLHGVLQASTDANAAWVALENRFDRQNLTSFNLLPKSLTTLQYVDGESISAHLTSFDNLWQRMGVKKLT